MITLIAASLAAATPAPATQPAPAGPHAQHGQQQQGSQPTRPHAMGKMEGCCCCKDMDGKAAPAGTKQGHRGH